MDEVPSGNLDIFGIEGSSFTSSGPYTSKRVDKETYGGFAVASTDGVSQQYLDEQGEWFSMIKYAKIFGTRAEANVAARNSGGEVVGVKTEFIAERL